MNLHKKIIAGLVTVTFICTTITPAFAKVEPEPEVANSPQVVMMDASEINMDVPQELVGMDQFLSVDSQGRIELDADAAMSAGYNERLILGVQEHLDKINTQVIAGKMYIDSDTYIAYGLTQKDIKWTGRGYTGIETTWYGATFLYYDIDQANALYKAFDSTYTNCMTLLDNLNQMSNDPDANTAYSLTVTAALVVGYSSLVYRNSVNTARQANTGIIWLINEDYSTGTIGWAFDKQIWSQITP